MPRLAVIEKPRCNPEKCDWLCVRLCPVNRGGEECIKRAAKASIDEDLCTGCGICSNRCPFQAISIINLPQELSEPIHRFGKNGFALYRLPIPKSGKVVGILGRNGIGKTTTIQILAGFIKPNLGTDKEVFYEELEKRFRGTEIQDYFEKLKDNKVKVSFKPQRVDEIPKNYKGKVINLLKKADEKNKLGDYSKILGISKILKSDIKNVSGGELQKIAIAAAALKHADVYFFDEPSSYLDIKERLNVARFVRNLTNEGASVMVIEHDLIILDYITDYIHLMYGKASAYGVVSQPLVSKAGINTYLSGFLKSENVRFRDKKIEFSSRSALKPKQTSNLASWPAFTKNLKTFSLISNPGNISKQEVVGILGQNSIGKTTFVKVLAGVEKPTNGRLNLKLKISYKPQYLESSSEQTVAQFLKDAIAHHQHDIITPLDLDPILLNNLSNLSGGELQRVAIAHCLTQDADLYLLDEPSAYLDVEQRLNTSRVVNEVMNSKGASALIVDHDLLFIDHVSNRLVVFEGIPAVKGLVGSPVSMEDGMNKLLSILNITLRRDEETSRPRINKEESLKDREQKKSKKYYYT